MSTACTQWMPRADLWVFCVKGQWVFGNASGTAPLVVSTELDAAVLCAACAGQSTDALVSALGESYGDDAVRGRVTWLSQGGLLVPYQPGVLSQVDLSPVTLKAEEDDVPSGIRISRHVALRPTPHGWAVWSARLRRDVLLTGEQVRDLMRCGVGAAATSEEVRARAVAEMSVARRAWLVALGVLVDVPAVGTVREATIDESEQPAPPAWTRETPDGRIPVYFAPHAGVRSIPLALGMLAAAIRGHDDGALLERFQLIPLSWDTPQGFLQGAPQRFGSGIWLFSDYVWSAPTNIQMSAMSAWMDPQGLRIHGGPSVPRYPRALSEFMSTHPSVDIAVHGEGELAIVEILERLVRRADGTLRLDEVHAQDVAGITYRLASGEVRSTSPRVPTTALDELPSPYLTGVFQDYADVPEAIIETNRGCPYGCTFCDWGSATRQKVRKFCMSRVREEITWAGQNRCRVLWIADANFGMYRRDVELAAHIVATKAAYGFPQEVAVNYMKNTNKLLAEIIQIFADGGIITQGILSVQTTDPDTLKVIERQNIRTDKYEELAGIFRATGLPLSTDLMLGLPGMTPAAFDRDLQHFFDVDIAVKGYMTTLLPNSPMADPAYIAEHGIVVDASGAVQSCHSYTAAEREAMLSIYRLFTTADGFGVLRYVARYLQWDHDIPALSFLHRLQAVLEADPDRLPTVHWVTRYLASYRFVPGGWRRFYDEIATLVVEDLGVARDAGLEAVLRYSEAVMPDEGRSAETVWTLPHDVVAWFRGHERGQGVPLATLGAGQVTVSDPDRLASLDLEDLPYDSHQYFWELPSPLRRATSDIRRARHAS